MAFEGLSGIEANAAFLKKLPVLSVDVTSFLVINILRRKTGISNKMQGSGTYHKVNSIHSFSTSSTHSKKCFVKT